ncbi:hypothetical protein, partial [Sphingomonas sp. GC_Shp_3]|uniref:hypothetical protein n=1 Tax=Sphingomonas sp. GC_Shp_3 TaxID=2937383 RepID=UPI00226A0A13
MFDNEQIQVLYLDGPGETLMLLFSPMGTYANGVSFWGQAPSDKLGYPAIGFVAKYANWFPSEDVEAALVMCEHIIQKYSQRVAIGQSMGGYAAIKYGKLMNATVSIAFAPQATIEPSLLPTTTNRFSQFYLPRFHDGMMITKQDISQSTYCVLDPKEQFDLDAYLRIKEVAPHIQRVDVLNVGHEVIRSFASTESFKLVVDLAQRHDTCGFRSFAQKARRNPGQRSTGICLYNIYKRPMLVFSLFKREYAHMLLKDVKGISLTLGH